MGLHYPFGYVGYEGSFLKTFIELLDNYCCSCHTNDDVKGDCKKCPIGNLIYSSKDYILSAYEYKVLDRETKIIKSIKREIKKIEPSPFFNGCFAFEGKRNKDELLILRELLKDLEFYKHQNLYSFVLREGIRGKMLNEVSKKVEAKMKKLKKKVE